LSPADPPSRWLTTEAHSLSPGCWGMTPYRIACNASHGACHLKERHSDPAHR